VNKGISGPAAKDGVDPSAEQPEQGKQLVAVREVVGTAHPQRVADLDLLQAVDSKVKPPLVFMDEDEGQRREWRAFRPTTDAEHLHALVPGRRPDPQLQAALLSTSPGTLGHNRNSRGREGQRVIVGLGDVKLVLCERC